MNNLYTNINSNNYQNFDSLSSNIESKRAESSFSESLIVTQYENAKKPFIQKRTSIKEILNTIKNGDKNLALIEEARRIGKGNSEYDIIKTEKLPTFRFNFNFNVSASNKNITTPTGLIYIDADNIDWIPFNKYIFARWKSLSNEGYGMLVKIEGLTVENFKDVYNELSDIINIKSDAGARKPTQQTVLSYDNDLYYNPNSETFSYKEKKEVSSSPIKEKKEEGIRRRDTYSSKNQKKTIRFNNIDDYFSDDTPYIVFKEKVKICNPFIPRIINEGSRNSILFFLLSQYALLNPNQGKNFLSAIGSTILSKMSPKLSKQELNATVSKIIAGRENNSLTLYFNEERRILFNPSVKLSFNEKMQITNRILGDSKKENTRASIYLALESWNFEIDGKITQSKVANKCKLSLATIKRYWNEFKEFMKDLHGI